MLHCKTPTSISYNLQNMEITPYKMYLTVTYVGLTLTPSSPIEFPDKSGFPHNFCPKR